MIKKLTKHGNSYAIVLSKAMLKTLDATEDTKFSIEFDGKQIIIKPAHIEKKMNKKAAPKETFPKISNKPSVQKIFEKLAKKHKAALKKLANN